MAARLNPRPWRFYVYTLLALGRVVYVGKGSGGRLVVQMRARGCDGCEVARFRREEDAYAFERQMIAECAPEWNKHPGGNGCRARRHAAGRALEWVRQMNEIGTRAYAARVVLQHLHLADPSKVDRIRQIAYGAGA